MRVNKRIMNIAIPLAIIFFASLFLYFGNQIAAEGMTALEKNNDYRSVEAVVTNILEVEERGSESEDDRIFTDIRFEATVLSGADKDKILTGRQTLDSYDLSYGINIKQVAIGDKVIFKSAAESDWSFLGFSRIGKMMILGIVFLALVLLFGRLQGLKTIISLAFTCAAIFIVFIPAILSGKNIYLSVIIVCAYSILVTIFLIYGINKKSIASVTGCFIGVISASILTFILSNVFRLTGLLNEETGRLLFLPEGSTIDLKAVIFAGIIIGVVGAIMDVSVSISSSLWEIKEQTQDLSFKQIYTSGVNIGKDIMGSMTTTLVFAYIGSSLTVMLLLIVYVDSFTELLNSEEVVVELLQSLIGSLGILFTMPITALVCAVLYSKKPKQDAEML